jgi:hypothetical protein
MQAKYLFNRERPSAWSQRIWLEKAGLLLLLVYVLAGVIYSAILSPVARFPDESEYLKLSYNLLHGPGFSMDGIHLTACRPPGYVFFLSAVRALDGDYFGFRAVQFLLLAGTAFLVYRLCSEGERFAGLLVVTGLVICYPVLFYTAGTLYPQTLSAFLFVGALNLLLITPRNLILNLCSGFVFGALILVVPTFLLTLGIVVLVARFLKIIRWQDVLMITLAACLVVGTWTLRNAVTFHRFVPVASNSGVNLLMGNNERATPYEAAANIGMEPYYQQNTKLGLDEFQGDQFYKDAALNWIKAHPGQALTLYFEKVLNFFNIMNVYVPGNHVEIPLWKQVLMAASYLLLLGLLGWRLGDIRRFPLIPREKLLLAVYILSAFTSAIFFTRIRHRLPYDYLIIAIIALNLSRRLEIWLTPQRAPEPLPTATQTA